MNHFATSLKEGQLVFFESHKRPGDIVSGVIKKIHIERIGPFNGNYSVRRELILNMPQWPEGFTRRNAEDVFPDENSCELYIMMRKGGQPRVEAYKAEITDVKSLLNFMFTHISESDTAAHAAALQRAQELLGYSKEELLARMRY
ncbi:MAG: hypothetical protein IJZ68_09195 [Bacteroidaceae bacterium]|nr:hypothetical protein [Bacteroidaceae bacterium]